MISSTQAHDLTKQAEDICAANDDWVFGVLNAAARAGRPSQAHRGLILFGIILGLATTENLDMDQLRTALAQAAAEHSNA